MRIDGMTAIVRLIRCRFCVTAALATKIQSMNCSDPIKYEFIVIPAKAGIQG
jgi:hypothetical protein